MAAPPRRATSCSGGVPTAVRRPEGAHEGCPYEAFLAAAPPRCATSRRAEGALSPWRVGRGGDRWNPWQSSLSKDIKSASAKNLRLIMNFLPTGRKLVN